MSLRRRSAVATVGTVALAAVFLQLLPDLSDRLQVIAQETYYWRQLLPNLSTDGAP
jgi:hypothetical protein